MASLPEIDLTVVYYTANIINEHFADNVRFQLSEASKPYPIISVSKKPINFGYNIVVDSPRSYLNIYRQALIGAKAAKTKYIALAEDDVLYSPEHFKHRSSPGVFAYSVANWGVYTWTKPPVYSWKGRRVLLGLICERELFIEAMEERFAKWPDDTKVNTDIWAEPGKYERQLGVTVRHTEKFWTHPPNIVFSHEDALAYANLGTRKRLGELRATALPYWGSIEDMMKVYKL